MKLAAIILAFAAAAFAAPIDAEARLCKCNGNQTAQVERAP